jgi:hypothetical protein
MMNYFNESVAENHTCHAVVKIKLSIIMGGVKK